MRIEKGRFYRYKRGEYSFFGVSQKKADGSDANVDLARRQLAILLSMPNGSSLRACNTEEHPIAGLFWYKTLGTQRVPKGPKTIPVEAIVNGKKTSKEWEVPEASVLFIDLGLNPKPIEVDVAQVKSTPKKVEFVDDKLEWEEGDELDLDEEEEEEEVSSEDEEEGEAEEEGVEEEVEEEPTPGQALAAEVLAEAREIIAKGANPIAVTEASVAQFLLTERLLGAVEELMNENRELNRTMRELLEGLK